MIHDWSCITAQHVAFACDIPTNRQDCTAIDASGNSVEDMLDDYSCVSTFKFACDVPVLGNRMSDIDDRVQSLENIAIEDRLQSLENIIDALDNAIDAEQESDSMPIGFDVPEAVGLFGVYNDYVMYGLALINVVLLVGVYCMTVRPDSAPKYRKVVNFDTDKA